MTQVVVLLAPASASAGDGGPCPDIAALLSRHLEGDVGKAQCAEMEGHVATCERCRAQCESLKQVLALCSTPAPTDGPAVRRAVERAIRELRSAT